MLDHSGFVEQEDWEPAVSVCPCILWRSAPHAKVPQEQSEKATGLDDLQSAFSEEARDKERENLNGREVEWVL